MSHSKADQWMDRIEEDRATTALIANLKAKLAEVSSNLDHAVHQIEMLNGKLARAREALEEVLDQVPGHHLSFGLDRSIRAALTDTPPTD